MSRRVQEALEAAGDVAGALLWRRLCNQLEGEGLRVGVAARDPAAARRVVEQVAVPPGVRWVVIPLGSAEEEGPPQVGLGAVDRLLGVHALVVATPMVAALGTSERDGLASLQAAGAPAARALTLGDAHLVERLADDPEAERAEVRARVQALLPDGWPLIEATQLTGWIGGLAADLHQVASRRRSEVAGVLLREGLDRLKLAQQAERARADTLDALLAAEDQALAEARRAGRRVAAHTLAVIRRQTERLDLDLQAFLRTLEQQLPAEVAAVDPSSARRVLPHWLTHVTEGWMADRLAAWRREVLRELAEIEIDEAVRAELLVPALQPAPVRGESRWARRLGSTAAFGGAAALLAFGLWVPALLALAGGLAGATLGRGDSDAGHRERLVSTARGALREMGADAQRLLGDQVQQLSDELDRLADEGEAAEREARAATRTQLGARRVDADRELASIAAAQAALTQALEDLPA